MKDLLKRLISRKFLLALAGILVFIANQQWTELTVVILGYLGSEGAADAVARYSTTKFVEAPVATTKAVNSFFNEDPDDDVDKDQEPVPGQ